MLILDVNPLVYAFRPDLPDHERHRRMLLQIMAGPEAFGVPDVVFSSFIRICTNRRIFTEPSPMAEVISFAEAVRGAPPAVFLPSTTEQWRAFLALCSRPDVTGNHVPDAFIASFVLAYDADLVTSDAAMGRFPGVRIRDVAGD